jgi:hypothetical protein
MIDYNGMDFLLRYADVLFDTVVLDRVELAKELSKAYETGFQRGFDEGEKYGAQIHDSHKPLAHCMFSSD